MLSGPHVSLRAFLVRRSSEVQLSSVVDASLEQLCGTPCDEFDGLGCGVQGVRLRLRLQGSGI